MGQLKRWLLAQAGQHRRNLNLVLYGAATCFAGLGLVYFSEHHLSPSLEQELTALAGLLLTATGVIVAALGYVALSILRIFKFIDDDNA
ncbi:hypothetical protein [Motiliproteus sp. SC1-56]|uniref:hypothetical protein n=1 Tax=Motiliproteus sp. SC1-56 TaxID=2799565 RepID=UPI001A8C2800|nr:hypothetical protein [Motiliproteus sp. SC1-56]